MVVLIVSDSALLMIIIYNSVLPLLYARPLSGSNDSRDSTLLMIIIYDSKLPYYNVLRHIIGGYYRVIIIDCYRVVIGDYYRVIIDSVIGAHEKKISHTAFPE